MADPLQTVGAVTRLGEAPAELSPDELVSRTAGWIRHQTPVAIVRFGEGEGRLLTANSSDQLSMKVAARKLRRQSGIVFPPQDVLRIKSQVMRAFDEADVVGIRGSQSFSDEHKMWVAQIERAFEERVAEGRPPAHVSHCLLNNALRDALPSLLAGQSRVSVVSCRDVKPYLATMCGVEDVRVFQVPSQYIVRGVDGDYEAALHGVPIWPGFYDNVRASLSVRTLGEIFLVGAGIFGKELCVRIRDLGGIALDLGSSLDGMADKVTRGPNKPDPYPLPSA